MPMRAQRGGGSDMSDGDRIDQRAAASARGSAELRPPAAVSPRAHCPTRLTAASFHMSVGPDSMEAPCCARPCQAADGSAVAQLLSLRLQRQNGSSGEPPAALADRSLSCAWAHPLPLIRPDLCRSSAGQRSASASDSRRPSALSDSLAAAARPLPFGHPCHPTSLIRRSSSSHRRQ